MPVEDHRQDVLDGPLVVPCAAAGHQEPEWLAHRVAISPSGRVRAKGLACDRANSAGDGPVPWTGFLPGPQFLARVLPEAQCQGGPKVISEGNAKRA